MANKGSRRVARICFNAKVIVNEPHYYLKAMPYQKCIKNLEKLAIQEDFGTFTEIKIFHAC